MFLNYSWAVWLAWTLAAFFVVNGIVNLSGYRPMREGLVRWGFPRWFFIVNGLCDLAISAAIAWYPTRPFGLLLSALLCIAIWIVLLRNRDYAHLPPSIVLFGVTLLTAWGLRLI